jgi:hypothetical protein
MVFQMSNRYDAKAKANLVKLFFGACKLNQNWVVHVFVIVLRELERLVAVPDVLAVVSEDLALQPLRDAFLDE